ncbi:DUF1641 domain-containing protein [Metabacillus idriensis]|uniref:DUF1641 domain-containing protein n=1 Tax=Metabacillus idriensis TaxID=324768 RepID=UPI003D279C1C
MAKATKTINRIEKTEEDKRKEDLREVEDALISHKEAIIDTLEILQHMQDRGVLPLLKGLFGQGDKVMDILVKTVDKKETTNSLKNLLLMTGVLGMINVKQLEPFLLKVNAGVARVAENKDPAEKTSYFDLARSLKDPEVNRAVTLLISFLKGMGQETEHIEKTAQSKENQVRHKNETLE